MDSWVGIAAHDTMDVKIGATTLINCAVLLDPIVNGLYLGRHKTPSTPIDVLRFEAIRYEPLTVML